jgi:protein-tyrosine phosphatase
MLEIHYHLLFDVDDGPRNLEASIELAEMSIAEGVTHIVSTPHSNDEFVFRPERNRERLEILKAHFGDKVTLGLGCDFQLSEENLAAFAVTPASFTINGTRYLLAELSDYGIPRWFDDTLAKLAADGYVPIITHPERNPILLTQPERLASWIELGCLIQVTAGSFHGRFGRRAKAMTEDMVAKNWVHLVASDAHGVDFRPPEMGAAFKAIRQRFDVETAERLCTRNPKAIFDGADFPSQPEPKGVGANAKRGFGNMMSKLFGS